MWNSSFSISDSSPFLTRRLRATGHCPNGQSAPGAPTHILVHRAHRLKSAAPEYLLGHYDRIIDLILFGHLKKIGLWPKECRHAHCIFVRNPKLFANGQGRNEGGTISRAPKSPDHVTSTFFNRVHSLPKVLRLEHGGAKLASCTGPI